MSGTTLNKIRAEALGLTEDERAELARDLIASLDAPADPDTATAWDAEIARRVAEIDSGTAKLIDRAELRRRMQQRISND
jgi:putative addiction module component (TIGR02574 family)